MDLHACLFVACPSLSWCVILESFSKVGFTKAEMKSSSARSEGIKSKVSCPALSNVQKASMGSFFHKERQKYSLSNYSKALNFSLPTCKRKLNVETTICWKSSSRQKQHETFVAHMQFICQGQSTCVLEFEMSLLRSPVALT